MSDDFTLFDVLQKFKEQVRVMATKLNQLNQHLNLIENPTNPSTHQEVLKIKRNIINDITHLLKETKPLSNNIAIIIYQFFSSILFQCSYNYIFLTDYPSFQTLSSVKLLKTFEKISSECKLLLNNIQQNNENMIKRTDRYLILS